MPRTSASADPKMMADLLEQLGDIDPRRVCLDPPPGRATERDVIRIHDRTDRLFELVDGALVEKVMGFREAFLALWVGRLLGNFAEDHDRGIVVGADGTVRLMPKLVRIPDVSFFPWEQLPNREVPTAPIPDLTPALAVEVLSKGNTPGEMERKLKEYFLAGTSLVWFVDPKKRSVEVFTAPDVSVVLTEGQTLDGGDVLPGLALPVSKIFAKVPRQAGKNKGTRQPKRKPRRNGGAS